MKILLVASYNKDRFAPFIVEQAKALEQKGCEIDFFGLQGKGVKGYLSNLPFLKKKTAEFHPNIIHAHYGLSGLLANMQRNVPVVTTYHGSDINDKKALFFSRWSMKLSAWNVFVSQRTLEKAGDKQKSSLLPCGIDLTDLQLMSRFDARQQLNLNQEKKYVLFAGAFDNAVKNVSLAKNAIAYMKNENVELLEMKGYSRDEVTLMMCAADAFLMTSFMEGSPQVIKEAMACGCPIVSVDVGDVRERTHDIEGCYVSDTQEPEELASKLMKAFTFENKTKGRDRIISEGLDNKVVAEKLMEIYRRVVKPNESIS